ncbi:uncharacterized protein LOC113634393 isoform X3 [Tachysurus fulvidraco]|uniref:uncharacterized protein LOC113634393 isoform X3 n=1 Tax=Tachysurus fulvidraco TaxID=1234273 RepID=UPI001FEE2798|nr:uncharacterized protein LOC113634393 isoform X3 [Tachysurus fulvidraco]
MADTAAVVYVCSGLFSTSVLHFDVFLRTSAHIEGIMTWALGILCITTFLTVLPCELQTVDTETPHIMWTIDTETVFERRGKETYEGEGYEGRVDVPEEELRKGNCSLVLKHLKLNDTADYMSYEMRGTRRLNRVKRSETPKIKLISSVHLSVNELPPKEDRSITPVPSADPGMKCPHLLVMVLSFICLLIQLF